jgi:RNA polymerase sigma factor FliA
LKSYARFRIRGAILDSLRQLDWSPRHLRRQARQIEQANRDLAAELGRNPTEPEIAQKLGITLEELQHQLGELRGLDLGSLQAQADEHGGEEPIATTVAHHEEDPFQLAARSELRGLLAEGIEQLEDKEKQVLGLYYLEELTMKEVGILLDVGESRVSQIHSAALLRLRSWLTDRLRPALEKSRRS